VDVLHKAAWSPIDKTQTHIDTEREINRLKYKQRDDALDSKLKELYNKLEELGKTGWKINENNLATLPADAPQAAHLLARRILLESRRRTLTEWTLLVAGDGRIHGRFQGIGAWTHRMAHQNPNTANIPNEFDTEGNVKLLGKELRQLWQAPKKRLLVGVDAEGIQLRIFAHYIDDKEFTDALVKGKKSDKSDPHSLNQRILGPVCKTRSGAKRFIYALLLGAGISKLAQILAASEDETRRALDNLLERYEGFARLKTSIIPADAKRGWFIGLDGRKVSIPGDTPGERKHLCMSGYLQNGEAVVMKLATLKWYPVLKQEAAMLVDMVHDEWQTETPNDMEKALRVAESQCKALEDVGKELKLKCPLAGSYYNEDHKDYTIGTNWYRTH
jgi:DNA polymerase-1